MIRICHGLLILAAVLGPGVSYADVGLDRSFGNGGVVSSALSEVTLGIGVQRGGGVVAVGRASSDAGFGVLLIRFTTTGALDTSFGSGGYEQFFAPGFSLSASAAALQPDDQMVVVGRADDLTGSQFFVARFDADGAPDPSFGVGGIAMLAFPALDAGAVAVALQPDGKVVAAGFVWPHVSIYSFGVARFNPDGSPDATFGAGGSVTIDMGGSVQVSTSVLLQNSGRIVLGGMRIHDGSSDELVLVGLDSTGVLDPAFGTLGKVFFPPSAGIYCGSLALQRDDKIVVAGVQGAGLVALRFLPNGALDEGFGAGGFATLACQPANAVTIDAGGSIVLAGGNDEFILARLLNDGTPDPSLGPGGWVHTLDVSPPKFSYPNALALQPDGAIVLGGSHMSGDSSVLTLVRYVGQAGAPIPALSVSGALLLAMVLGLAGLLAIRRPA
jgi:uncharacterized delta-60 repeat protein